MKTTDFTPQEIANRICKMSTGDNVAPADLVEWVASNMDSLFAEKHVEVKESFVTHKDELVVNRSIFTAVEAAGFDY